MKIQLKITKSKLDIFNFIGKTIRKTTFVIRAYQESCFIMDESWVKMSNWKSLRYYSRINHLKQKILRLK